MNVTKGNGRIVAPAPACQSEQDEQWLVRGTLVAFFPDAQGVEQLEDFFPAHSSVAINNPIRQQ
jgi:hypothetical protein